MMDVELADKLNAPLDSLIRNNREHREKRRGGSDRGSGEKDRREVCRDHMRGNCTRGTDCPYSHTAPKEPCRDFQRGSCTRGKECPYSHKVPKDICRDYLLRDDCARGASCPYKHPNKRLGGSGGSSIESLSPASAAGGPEVCRDYLRGECVRGVACPFLHSDNVIPVCRDFIRGSCNRGDTCPYHHLPNFRSTATEICRDFQRSGCSRGASCPYLHIPEYVEICRDFQRGHCRRGLVCPFHHGQTVSSPSTKRRREDDHGRSRSRDVESLIEENRRLRARLAAQH